MKNLDSIRNQYAQKFTDAANAETPEAVSQAMAGVFSDFAREIEQSVIEEARKATEMNDNSILAARGTRVLTSEEKKYYETLIGALRSPDPKQSLTEMDVVLPTTIINDVFEDLVQQYPLLDAIDFQNAGAVTEWLLNSNPRQMASWSPLCAEIVKELTSGFRKIDLQQNKLSAWMPVCKAMLDLGPVWLDRYVRAVLAEALAFGLEDGIINGRGQGNSTSDLHEPIGMRKDLSASFDPTNGYPDKIAIEVTSLDSVAYGDLVARLSKTEKGNPRIVQNVIFIVNPTDYLKKVMPATTPRSTDGTYRHDVYPFPTTVVQSTALSEGEAILGLGKRYLMAAGTGKSGKIDHSDEYKFLEDIRVYLTKFYGHGQPKDNNSFLLLDISNLKPTALQVQVVNADDFPTA